MLDIACSELGKTLDREKNTGKEVKYLCITNVQWNKFDLSTLKSMKIEPSEFERYKINKGDLLICEGGDVGRSAIWNYDESIFYQNAIHRVRFKEGINAYYILLLLRYLKNKGIIDKYSKGMTIKHFTKTALNAIPLAIPSNKEQIRIVARVKDLYQVLDNISNSIVDEV